MTRAIGAFIGACLGALALCAVMPALTPQTGIDTPTFGTVGACMGGLVGLFWGKPRK